MWWLKYFQSPKDPQHDLKVFTEEIKEHLCSRLKSLILFGSMASGEFNPEYSNVNLLILGTDKPENWLKAISRSIYEWNRRGHTVPTLMSIDELPKFCKQFPIEFMDMKDHHRILWGDNPLISLSIDTTDLQRQCEKELAVKIIQIRQKIAPTWENGKKLRAVLVHSLAGVFSIFRGCLRLTQQVTRIPKLEAAQTFVRNIGKDPATLSTMNTLRFYTVSADIHTIALEYLELLDTGLDWVRKQNP